MLLSSITEFLLEESEWDPEDQRKSDPAQRDWCLLMKLQVLYHSFITLFISLFGFFIGNYQHDYTSTLYQITNITLQMKIKF